MFDQAAGTLLESRFLQGKQTAPTGRGFSRWMRAPVRHLQFRHRHSLKQSLAGLRQPPGTIVGAVHAGAVGGDSGIGVHLAIEF